MKIDDDTSAVMLLTRGGSRIAVGHTMTQVVVERDSDLAGRRGDGLGLANARGRAPVECSQLGVRASDRDCGKPN